MRRDISVYNEASGFTLHSGNFTGRERGEILENLYRSVEEGLVIPIKLVQDSGPSVRVVTGDLTPQEEDEWVDKLVWKLSLPDGVLVLEGGLDPSGPNEDFLRSVEVEPGDYRVEVYTFFWGINGFDSLTPDQVEPVGTWFRRTRAGKKFPDHMKFYLGENSEEDPGHEEEWDEFYDSEEYEDLEEPDLVDFLVRLVPLSGSAPQLRCDPSGWFPIGLNPRKPEKCPLGVIFKPA